MQKEMRTRGTILLYFFVAACAGVVGSYAFVPTRGYAATETLYPNAGGASTQWTAAGAASNYLAVDETSANDDTDYVKTDDNAFVDNYGMQDSSIGANDTINSVTVTVRARVEGTATGLSYGLKTGGTNYYAATGNLGTAYAVFSNTWTVNPATSAAWTKTQVDGLQAAIKQDATCQLAENGRPRGLAFLQTAFAATTICTVRVTQIYVTVDYTVVSSLTLRPNAGGASAQWTAAGAASNYLAVDETSANDDTDYVTTDDNAFVDNYGLQDSTLSQYDTINSVKVTVRANASFPAGGSAILSYGLRTNSTNYSASTGDLTTSYADYSNTWTTNPATGQAWTKSEVDALQTYIKVGTCVAGEVRKSHDYEFAFASKALAASTSCTYKVTQIFVAVLYTAGSAPADTAGGIPFVPGKLLFSGKGFPGGKMIFYGGGVPLRQSVIETRDGSFSFEITLEGLETRQVDFRLLFVDRDGRSALLKTVAHEVGVNQYFIENVTPPPTLSFDRALITKGDSLLLSGSAIYGSEVEVFIDQRMITKVRSGGGGRYAAVVNTSVHNLSLGSHTAGVRSRDGDGRVSEMSLLKRFTVSPFGVARGDFTGDGAVDIRDWSVFIAKRNDSAFRDALDLNGDRTVDVLDLSIFLSMIKQQ